jgi:hypothetical protein
LTSSGAPGPAGQNAPSHVAQEQTNQSNQLAEQFRTQNHGSDRIKKSAWQNFYSDFFPRTGAKNDQNFCLQIFKKEQKINNDVDGFRVQCLKGIYDNRTSYFPFLCKWQNFPAKT